MDQMVLKVQQWLNFTYGYRKGFNLIEEDGYTGWGTIGALITALQFELGVESPNGVFGPTTTQLYKDKIGSLSTNSIVERTNLNRIVQGALYCKGYDPKEFADSFSTSTSNAIKVLQKDAGIPETGTVDVILLKSLLTMDAFKLLNFGSYNGKEIIRTIQQYLNKNYISNSYFSEDVGIVPCDGIYGRNTNKALIYALQIEGNIPVPNGVFGPATLSSCLAIPSESRDPKRVYLLQAALYCNGFDPNGFDGSFGNGAKTAVMKFQEFSALNIDGSAGKQTWQSLLLSTGDPSRKGTACDTSMVITQERALTLKNDGRLYVGRYLTGKSGIRPEELNVIYRNGLKLIPLMQVLGDTNYYFSSTSGLRDAKSALSIAKLNSFADNTVIYFAVDFDVLQSDLAPYIEPYFNSIKKVFNDNTANPKHYRIGVYAPRSVCSYLSEKGYTCSSYVSDMSTGFSGNLGQKLPDNWSFDQIYENKAGIGVGLGHITYDNVIARPNHIEYCSSVSTDYLHSDLTKIINNNSLVKALGIELSAAGTIVFIDSPNLKVSLTAGYKYSITDDSATVIKIKNGEFDSAEFANDLSTLKASISPEMIPTLTQSLKLLEGVDASISISSSTNYIKIEIESDIETSNPPPMLIDVTGMSICLSIEIKKEDGISPSEFADSIYKEIKDCMIEIGGIAVTFCQKLLDLLPYIISILLSIIGGIAVIGLIISSSSISAFSSIVCALGFLFIKLVS